VKVLLDTCVVLDALLARSPWAEHALILWNAADRGQLDCHVTASSITDLYYLSSKARGAEVAGHVVRTCLDSLSLIPVDRGAIERALELAGPDFEDNLQVACAAAIPLDAIVTRDAVGFVGSPIPVLTPGTLAGQIRLAVIPSPNDPPPPAPGNGRTGEEPAP